MALQVSVLNTADTVKQITVADPNQHGSSKHYILKPGASFTAVLDKANSLVFYEHEDPTILEKSNA